MLERVLHIMNEAHPVKYWSGPALWSMSQQIKHKTYHTDSYSIDRERDCRVRNMHDDSVWQGIGINYACKEQRLRL